MVPICGHIVTLKYPLGLQGSNSKLLGPPTVKDKLNNFDTVDMDRNNLNKDNLTMLCEHGNIEENVVRVQVGNVTG